jgi:hypothetical protein
MQTSELSPSRILVSSVSARAKLLGTKICIYTSEKRVRGTGNEILRVHVSIIQILNRILLAEMKHTLSVAAQSKQCTVSGKEIVSSNTAQETRKSFIATHIIFR